jgi:hypothetical protein
VGQQKKVNRREFLQGAAASSGFFVLNLKSTSFAGNRPSTLTRSPSLSPLKFFSNLERKALGKLCDHVHPDASDLGAVLYIETLLCAFESNPPRIFAGGPFSGRGRGNENLENDFEKFMPLNRQQELAWRLRIYGESATTSGSPNHHILGPQKGLREIFRKGIGWASRQIPESGLVSKPQHISAIYGLLDADCREALTTLTLESCYSAPEYGGNRNGQGWSCIHFAGDVAPFGHSHYNSLTGSYEEDPAAPMTTANPGTDGDPLSVETRGLFAIVSRFAKGRKFY